MGITSFIISLGISLYWGSATSFHHAWSGTEAQKKDLVGSGVYRTSRDYLTHQLYLGINCKTEKHKIRINEFFDKPFITVKHGGKSYHLQKDSIF